MAKKNEQPRKSQTSCDHNESVNIQNVDSNNNNPFVYSGFDLYPIGHCVRVSGRGRGRGSKIALNAQVERDSYQSDSIVYNQNQFMDN